MTQNLWERIQRGMEAGFDSALSAVHAITEKAGETIELTRLRREKARLENKITKELADLGHSVYQKISKEKLSDIAKELGIDEKLKEVSSEEARMIEIDKKISTEEVSKNKNKSEGTKK